MAENVEPLVHSPKSLYELCVARIVASTGGDFIPYLDYLIYLPKEVMFDVYYQVYKAGTHPFFILTELCRFEVFSKMLAVTSRRVDLFKCFEDCAQSVPRFKDELIIQYSPCSCVNVNLAARERLINAGLILGGFLSDAGWYPQSENILLKCLRLCLLSSSTPQHWCRILECYHRLLHVQAAYCSFKCAEETQNCALVIVKRLKEAKFDCNYAALYSEFSMLHYMRNEYDETYRWSIKALKQLKPTLPARITIDVLRQAAKSCVLKRKLQKAGLLIRQALYLARQEFEKNHPVYTNVLIDYGYYLLNFDSLFHSVNVYEEALSLRKSVFSEFNLNVALALENFAYALYVHEYTSGSFEVASPYSTSRECVLKARDTMESLLPGDHLLLASTRRVHALILEEIAINDTALMRTSLLIAAANLHRSALNLSRKAFGESNVQIAKHYGNLGRLYQSMGKFQEAAAMHTKAIRIKEELLGPDDFEVGLSIGHLASLYNFDMKRYEDAERLYHRSIAINLKLFGESYSGLEYDYRGLIHLYTQMHEDDKKMEYETTLINWRILRFEHIQAEDPPIDHQGRPLPLEEVLDAFFST
nr:amyloid protein-binding protein 2 isoform X2 [Nomia melanderi]